MEDPTPGPVDNKAPTADPEAQTKTDGVRGLTVVKVPPTPTTHGRIVNQTARHSRPANGHHIPGPASPKRTPHTTVRATEIGQTTRAGHLMAARHPSLHKATFSVDSMPTKTARARQVARPKPPRVRRARTARQPENIKICVTPKNAQPLFDLSGFQPIV